MDEIIGETLRKLWPLAPWTSSNISWPLSTLSLITGSLLSLVFKTCAFLSLMAFSYSQSLLKVRSLLSSDLCQFPALSQTLCSLFPLCSLTLPSVSFPYYVILIFFASGYSSSKIYVLLYSIELNFPAVVRLLFFQGMGVPCDFYDCWNSVLLQWLTWV